MCRKIYINIEIKEATQDFCNYIIFLWFYFVNKIIMFYKPFLPSMYVCMFD